MRVLEDLIFNLVNFTSGQLDPSYEKIAHKTALASSCRLPNSSEKALMAGYRSNAAAW